MRNRLSGTDSLLAVLAAGGVLLCSAPLAPRGPIEEAPSPPGRIIRSWVAGCGTGEDLWKYRDSTTVRCDEGGTALLGTEGALEWPVDLTGSEIDRLVVEGEELDRVRFELRWAASEEPFRSERSAAPLASTRNSSEVVFELAASPEWRGEVRRLRLAWSGTPSQNSRVTEVRVEKRGPPL